MGSDRASFRRDAHRPTGPPKPKWAVEEATTLASIHDPVSPKGRRRSVTSQEEISVPANMAVFEHQRLERSRVKPKKGKGKRESPGEAKSTGGASMSPQGRAALKSRGAAGGTFGISDVGRFGPSNVELGAQDGHATFAPRGLRAVSVPPSKTMDSGTQFTKGYDIPKWALSPEPGHPMPPGPKAREGSQTFPAAKPELKRFGSMRSQYNPGPQRSPQHAYICS